jgi:hypothetical protein
VARLPFKPAYLSASRRRKLDAVIVAEAWDAVKAIRERIVPAERG